MDGDEQEEEEEEEEVYMGSVSLRAIVRAICRARWVSTRLDRHKFSTLSRFAESFGSARKQPRGHSFLLDTRLFALPPRPPPPHHDQTTAATTSNHA